MRNLMDKVATLVGPSRGSKEDAKQRLKVVLIHDQLALTPGAMDQMKAEMLEVVRRYVVVDEPVAFELRKEDGQVSIVSQLPVRPMHARA